MLVLQRKIGESLFIGDEIELTIVDINSDRVKLAFKAPKSISIMRTELIEAAKTNQESASLSENSISALQNILKNKDL